MEQCGLIYIFRSKLSYVHLLFIPNMIYFHKIFFNKSNILFINDNIISYKYTKSKFDCKFLFKYNVLISNHLYNDNAFKYLITFHYLIEALFLLILKKCISNLVTILLKRPKLNLLILYIK